MKIALATVLLSYTAVSARALAGENLRGMSVPCSGGSGNPLAQCLTAEQVAQLAYDVCDSNGCVDRVNFCVSAVAVSFGESSRFDSDTLDCGLSNPSCFDSKARGAGNCVGLWQMLIDGGGEPEEQASSLWKNYAAGDDVTEAYCTTTGTWPPPGGLNPVGNLPAEASDKSWRFCRGAFTGEGLANDGSVHNDMYYGQFGPAAVEACNAVA